MTLKFQTFNVIDAFSRASLAIEADTSLASKSINRPSTRKCFRPVRQAQGHQDRQRVWIHFHRIWVVAYRTWNLDSNYSTRQAYAELLHRNIQPSVPVSQSETLPIYRYPRGQGPHRRIDWRIQRSNISQSPAKPNSHRIETVNSCSAIQLILYWRTDTYTTSVENK